MKRGAMMELEGGFNGRLRTLSRPKKTPYRKTVDETTKEIIRRMSDYIPNEVIISTVMMVDVDVIDKAMRHEVDGDWVKRKEIDDDTKASVHRLYKNLIRQNMIGRELFRVMSWVLLIEEDKIIEVLTTPMPTGYTRRYR